MKKCSKCKIEKEESEFSKSKVNKDGLRPWCKDCCRGYAKTDKYKEYQREYHREYRKTDKYKEYQKEYHKTDKYKEYQKEYNKEYQKEYQNSDNFKKWRSKYRKKKRAIDPKYKLDRNMTTAIYITLRGKKAGRTWESLVGYSVEDLMKHIESQFEPWMNWDNWGIGKCKWNIDHIKPKSLFDYTNSEDKEFRECWALKNLQPMESIKNIKKSNRYKL